MPRKAKPMRRIKKGPNRAPGRPVGNRRQPVSRRGGGKAKSMGRRGSVSLPGFRR